MNLVITNNTNSSGGTGHRGTIFGGGHGGSESIDIDRYYYCSNLGKFTRFWRSNKRKKRDLEHVQAMSLV